MGRDPERVRLVAEEATTAGRGGRVHGHVSDLSLMSNVRVLADEIRGHHEHVDVLANNAGALFASRKETSEGLEQTFALNHLAPFLLTNLLRDRLAGGRVVTTASGAHRSGRLDLDDLQSEKSYSPRVYGTSKLCNILFTRELARRAPELNANCFHPGVVRTGFAKNENGIWKVIATLLGRVSGCATGRRRFGWLGDPPRAAVVAHASRLGLIVCTQLKERVTGPWRTRLLRRTAPRLASADVLPSPRARTPHRAQMRDQCLGLRARVTWSLSRDGVPSVAADQVRGRRRAC